MEPPEDPRVTLAVERTLLAWIRTGLALMGFGFVVARLGLFLQELALAHGESPPTPRRSMFVVGALLLALGAAVNVTASLQHGWSSSARFSGTVPRSVRFAAGLGIATGLLGIGLMLYLTWF